MTRRPARRPTAARSPREWAVRGGLAAAALALGYVSTAQTLAYALVRTDPERAFALSPNDGRVAGALAQQIAGSEGADRPRADRLARRALAAEPLAVKALTALAIDTQIAGNTPAARRLFVHSEALSRRELGTRLWLIEDAVARGDVPGALRHYDIALRTERSAPELLFPVLSSAISDPAIAAALLDTLKRKPNWADAFVFQLGFTDTDPRVRAAFMESLARSGLKVPPAAQVSVVNALIAAGRIDEAWRLHVGTRRDVARDRSRDPRFSAAIDTPSPFDWNPVTDDSGISASIQSAPGGGVFDFSVPVTVGGVMLQQAQALPAGRYRLSGRSAEIAQDASAAPYWTLVCGDGRELGRVTVPNSAQDAGRFAGEFTVSGNCPVQFLRLVARPSSATGGLSGRIEQVTLVPVGGAG